MLLFQSSPLGMVVVKDFSKISLLLIRSKAEGLLIFVTSRIARPRFLSLKYAHQAVSPLRKRFTGLDVALLYFQSCGGWY